MTRRLLAVVLSLVTVAVVAGSLLSGAPPSARTLPAARLASASSTLFGVTTGSLGLTTATTEFGALPVTRVYYSALPASNAWSSTGLGGANHAGVVISFKALPDTILAGTDDAVLSHFFDTAPRDVPVWYSYYHEPEDNIKDGQFTAADYRAAWVHVAALANAANNPELHSTLILMAYTLEPQSHRNWEDYYPGSSVISTLGWDAYPPGGVGTPAPATFMGAAVALSKSLGKPFGFAEFGTTTVPGRPAWLTSIGAYLRSSGAEFGTLYDSTNNGGLGASGTFIVADPASLNAWKAVVQGSGSLPTPTATATATARPTTSPTATATATATPAPTQPTPLLTGLSAGSAITNGSAATISMTLRASASVTVEILNAKGQVVRLLRPAASHAAGTLRVGYWGYDGSGHLLPSGTYSVLVIATTPPLTSTDQVPLLITNSAGGGSH